MLFLLTLATQPAGAETIIVGGTVTSHGHVTITDTITVSNLKDLPEGAYVAYNAPIYGSFSDDGFSQSITGFQQTASPTSASATDTPVSSGDLNIRYKQYNWSLAGYQGSTFTATVTTTFDYAVTANPQPYAFTDPFTSPGGVTAGATTEAQAVDMIANYIELNEPGNCQARSGLMVELAQNAGLRARVVQGITGDTPITTPQFVYDNAIHQLSITWPREGGLHEWVEVYYPAEGKWVSYDPPIEKGFADQRHLAMGTSPGTDSALFRVDAYTNPGVTLNRQSSMSFSGVTDSGGYTFRYLDPAPAGISARDFPMGRDMVNAAIPTPTPTPTPSPTPVMNATITPTATPSPTPAANATPVATQPPVHEDINTTPGTTQYYVRGTIVDAKNNTPLSGVTLTLDGQPVTAGPDGSFAIAAAEGTHTLSVSAPGYDTINASVVLAGENLTETLRMSQVTVNGSPPPNPGFEIALALLGLLIIGLYRHGRA